MRGTTDVTWSVQTVLQAGAPGFIVSDLKPATKYLFFLVPFFRTVDGRPSNLREAITLEDGKFGFYFFKIYVKYVLS
jgi:hypothetical protein